MSNQPPDLSVSRAEPARTSEPFVRQKWHRASGRLVRNCRRALQQAYGSGPDVPNVQELSAYDERTLRVLLQWTSRGIDEPQARALLARACARAWAETRLPAEPEVYEAIRRAHLLASPPESAQLRNWLLNIYEDHPDVPEVDDLVRVPSAVHRTIGALVDSGWPPGLLCALVDEATWQTFRSLSPRVWFRSLEHALEVV